MDELNYALWIEWTLLRFGVVLLTDYKRGRRDYAIPGNQGI